MGTITSLQNARVKQAVRLRERRQRQQQQRFVIDGARELGRAMAAGVAMVEVFVCETLCQSEDARRVLELLPQSGAEVLQVNEPVFEKLAFGSRDEGVLGVAAMPDVGLERIALPERPLVAVLEGIEKPGNVGAVLRSVDGAGVSALVVADRGTDLFNPNVIRASLGTLFTVPVAMASTAETAGWLQDRGLTIYAAIVDGSVPYTEADFRGPAAIVLGSEATGLSDAWRVDGVVGIRLPMLGVADSLNVSTAAAVLFYEALRQRSVAHAS